MYFLLRLLVSLQNESLTKRIEDFEARQSKIMHKSQSLKSFSTLNNTLNEAESIEDQSKIEKSNHINLNSNEFIDWKRDIEKSLETVSDKVASNTTYLLIELEKSLTDINNEHNKLKKNFEDFVDNSSKKNSEKIEKTEKLITNIVQGMTEMKNSNVKWQADFLKNLNDFNEKMIVQESTLEELENFEKNVNKKFEFFNSEIKLIKNEIKMLPEILENKIKDNTSTFDKNIQLLFEENKKVSERLSSEILKIESICF